MVDENGQQSKTTPEIDRVNTTGRSFRYHGTVPDPAFIPRQPFALTFVHFMAAEVFCAAQYQNSCTATFA
jgi:hypothetical protein